MTDPTDDEAPSKEVSDLLDQLLARAIEDAAKEGADQVERAPKNPLATPERRAAPPEIGRGRRAKKPG